MFDSGNRGGKSSVNGGSLAHWREKREVLISFLETNHSDVHFKFLKLSCQFKFRCLINLQYSQAFRDVPNSWY